MRTYNIKPIETRYDGVLFRSRTEARWAVFFNVLKIKWYYEYEGFGLKTGKYLPDFYLPGYDAEGGCFAEVKGGAFEPEEIAKCKSLAVSTGLTVVMFDGIPDLKAYESFYVDGDEIRLINVIPSADQYDGEPALFVSPGYENKDRTIPKDMCDSLGFHFLCAVEAAKSYRF